MEYFYKLCKIGKSLYLQIWSKEDTKTKYIRSLGTAEKCQEYLVKLENKELQTKELLGKLTKTSEGIVEDSTKSI
jgi:predicted nucleotidyltransferase